MVQSRFDPELLSTIDRLQSENNDLSERLKSVEASLKAKQSQVKKLKAKLDSVQEKEEPAPRKPPVLKELKDLGRNVDFDERRVIMLKAQNSQLMKHNEFL